ncbi:MAG: right-handed parallel beta-helix repeat-containing protein, partial [bacterium]
DREVCAQPPATITIQGSAQATGSGPLTGSRDYRVRFFDSATKGSQLGSNLTGTLTLSLAGRFSFEITPPTQILSAADVWYELAIDSDATPNGIGVNDVFPDRVKVTSVPFALLAGDSAKLGGQQASIYATEAELASGAITVSGSAITTGTVPETQIDPAIARSSDLRRTYTAIVDDNSPADYSTIQAAILAGESSIFVRNGSYSLTADVQIPAAPFSLVGESRDGVRIDCADTHTIFYRGDTAIYNTGTASVNDNSIKVSGSGTSWLSNAAAGEFIRIDKTFHQISSVDTGTTITLTRPYRGPSKANVTYSIAQYGVGLAFRNLTLLNPVSTGSGAQNATNGGLCVRFARQVTVDNCAALPSTAASSNHLGILSYFENCQDVQMSHCMVRNLNLVDSENSSYVTISENIVENPTRRPIFFGGRTDDDPPLGFNITNNQIFGGGTDHFIFITSLTGANVPNHGIIANNQIFGVTTTSNPAADIFNGVIRLSNIPGGVVVSGNIVRDCAGNALVLAGIGSNADISITGNVFVNNTGWGIRTSSVGGTTRTLITNNVLSNNALGNVNASTVYGTLNYPTFENPTP